MSEYDYNDVFKQIDGVIYHCSEELAPFDLFTARSLFIAAYGIAEELQELLIKRKDGICILFEGVSNEIAFDLRTGGSIDKTYRFLKAVNQRCTEVKWVIEKASATDLIHLIETFQYNVNIKKGLYFTKYPNEYKGDPDHIFPFKFLKKAPTS